ncbi:MAG: ABC transporter permease [Actinomycetota bacterium]
MTARQVIFLVARREIVERLRSRAYLVSTAFTAVLVVGFIVVPAILSGDDDPAAVGVTGDRSAELADRIGELAVLFDFDADVETVAAGSADDLVADGDLDVVVSLDEIVVDESIGDVLLAVVTTAADDVANGASAEAPERLELRRLSDVDPDEEQQRVIVAFASTLILLLIVNAYAATVMTGVLEEKTTRVVELVLAAVPARWLLGGKLLGLGVLGLLQVVIIAAAGGAAGLLSSDVDLPSGFGSLVAMTIVWFVLGYAFYATAYAAAGSSVSRMEDAQAALAPISSVVMGAYLATALVIVPNPGSTAAQWLTQLPPVAPLAVPGRLAQNEIAAWEILLAGGLTLASVVGVVLLGGRLYAGSILRSGGRVSMREAWRDAEL